MLPLVWEPVVVQRATSTYTSLWGNLNPPVYIHSVDFSSDEYEKDLDIHRFWGKKGNTWDSYIVSTE